MSLWLSGVPCSMVAGLQEERGQETEENGKTFHDIPPTSHSMPQRLFSQYMSRSQERCQHWMGSVGGMARSQCKRPHRRGDCCLGNVVPHSLPWVDRNAHPPSCKALSPFLPLGLTALRTRSGGGGGPSPYQSQVCTDEVLVWFLCAGPGGLEDMTTYSGETGIG